MEKFREKYREDFTLEELKEFKEYYKNTFEHNFSRNNLINVPRGVKVKFKRELKKLNEHAANDNVYISKYKKHEKVKNDPNISYVGQSNCSCILKYESPGRYYMIIPFLKSIDNNLRSEPKEKNIKYVCFDPGVRTFLTGINQDGKILEVGKGDTTKIAYITKEISKFQGKSAQNQNQSDKIQNEEENNDENQTTQKKDNQVNKDEKMKKKKEERKKNKKIRRKYNKERKKRINRIEGLKKDLHWKLSNKLSKKYDHIVISKFQVSSMVKKTNTTINKHTRKAMLNWSHFDFRQKLKQKAQELNTVVHEVSEHYTSKTCSKCGNIKWNLGNNKLYECESCGFKSGRDWQAAKNILLKNFQLIKFELQNY
jgi:IS605 OrfB family transposase